MKLLSPRFSLPLASLLISAATAQVGPPRPLAPPPPAAPAPAPVPQTPASRFGQPLAGLTADQLADFTAGRVEFQNVETIATGLGPIYNNVSCVACHSTPNVGGSSAVTVTRFGRTVNGVFDPLVHLDGSLLHAKSINPILREVIPPEANTIAHRMTTPLFGAGLIEAIPDATIEANALATKGNGVIGKVALVTDEATGAILVGRFGWKAQHASLLTFAGDAYTNEMGITNRIFPVQPAPDGKVALLARFVSLTSGPEDVIDPLTGKADIDHFNDYMRYLAPPPKGAATAQSIAGGRVFAQVGCADCHTPSMTTGPNAIAALSNQTVELYSDLLLHDMGSLGDGIAQAAAGTTEMRTSPLWGLSWRKPYLHDGRAQTVDAAIRAHAGEAAPSRQQYLQLDSNSQRQLLAYLNTL